MAEQKKEQQIPARQAKEQPVEKPKAAEKTAQDKTAVPDTEKKDLIDTLQRLQAEFENYKKRIEKEKTQCLRIGKAGTVSALLAVIDSFDAAAEKLKKEKSQDFGLKLLHKQFLQAMQKIGLQEINAVGKQFNHETMDCMMQGNDNSKEEGVVLEEFQKGYLLDGIVLRHAKVKVNKRSTDEKQAECEKEKNLGKEMVAILAN